MEYGFIYRITCRATGKQYIGQVKEYKYKNGRPFQYGIRGRWSDHVSTARSGRTTPLCEAIVTHGPDAFNILEVTKAPLSDLDALESEWIQTSNTIAPNGYNVCRHSRNRHRPASNLADLYKNKVALGTISPIREGGELRSVYVRLKMHEGSWERIAFGQKHSMTYQDAYSDAVEFLNAVGCPYEEDKRNSDNMLERYSTKLNQFVGDELDKIRITTASSLIAVYVKPKGKPQVRICFGGKTVLKEIAYSLALDFVDALPKTQNTILEDLVRSPQQVAASKVET